MSNPPNLTNDQVQHLLAATEPLTPVQVHDLLRFLVQGQSDVEAKLRQLKMTVNRVGRSSG